MVKPNGYTYCLCLYRYLGGQAGMQYVGGWVGKQVGYTKMKKKGKQVNHRCVGG